MKRLLYTSVVTLLLVSSGFIIVTFMQSRSHPLVRAVEQDYATPAAIPTALVGFPDVEHVPIYPNASAIRTAILSNGYELPFTATNRDMHDDRYITYEAGEHVDKINEFYQEMLPKKGWVLRSSRDLTSLYSWSDPAQKMTWHLYLKVRLGLSLDQSKTVVNLEYGRYPAIEAGLPTYPDASQVATVITDTEETLPVGKSPSYVKDVTYVSSATSQEIADFYNNSMLEDGWSFFDRSGSGEVESQTGEISSQEGLFFRATRMGWDMQTIVSYRLFVTATVQMDGRALVKLHAEELEVSGGQ